MEMEAVAFGGYGKYRRKDKGILPVILMHVTLQFSDFKSNSFSLAC